MLEISHVKKSFGKNHVLRDVSMKVNKGDVIVILGPSGSGKTTLLRSLVFLEKADGGEMDFDGKSLDLKKARPVDISWVRKNTAFVFQSYNLFANKTALENVMLGLTVGRGMKKEMARQIALEALEEVGLADRKDYYPSQLSGGQQQRVALARIMAYEPSVILLDEPFSALDVFLKDRLQQEMMELLSDYDGTVILVSHSRDEIYRFSEELLVIDDGKQICYGDTKAIFDCPEQVEAARLTGCKNIVRVKRLDEHSIEIPDWGTRLHLEQEIDAEITHIGLRAHEFIPVWGEREDNCIPVKEKGKAEFPFEWKYFLKGETEESDDICWYVQKNLWDELTEKGIPDYLKLPEKEILLLK